MRDMRNMSCHAIYKGTAMTARQAKREGPERDERKTNGMNRKKPPSPPAANASRSVASGVLAFALLPLCVIVCSILAFRVVNGGRFTPIPCLLLRLNCLQYPITFAHLEPGYQRVGKTFEENFLAGDEIGASFVAYVGGKKVVELYGGFTDMETKEPYGADTLQLVFSSSKAVTGIVIARLVDQGLLDYGEKIATYWPEFGQRNKENVTVGHMLTHSAGVEFFDVPLHVKMFYDLDKVAELIAKEPHHHGGKNVKAYHAASVGWYMNEIVRRVDPQKRTIGQIIREDFSKQLGVEFYFGLPEALEPRVAPLRTTNVLKHLFSIPFKLRQLWNIFLYYVGLESEAELFMKVVRSFDAGNFGLEAFNSRDIHATESPATSGITNAHSLARFALLMASNGTLDNVEHISASTSKLAQTKLPSSRDLLLKVNTTLTTGGWGYFEDIGRGIKLPLVGWGGLGGSLILWNTQRNIAFGYAMNGAFQDMSLGDHRSWSLVRILEKCLDDVIATS